MSEPKFTKGPWHIEGDTGYYDGNYYYQIVDEVGYTIADVANLNDETKKVNAQLISCAPEMYEMLEKCRTALRNCGMSCLSEDVFLLLKKARGEE